MIEAGDRGRNIGRLVFHGIEKSGTFQDPLGEFKRKKAALTSRKAYLSDMYRRMKNPFIQKKLTTVEQKLKGLKAPEIGEKRFEFDLIPVKKSVARAPCGGSLSNKDTNYSGFLGLSSNTQQII